MVSQLKSLIERYTLEIARIQKNNHYWTTGDTYRLSTLQEVVRELERIINVAV